MDRKRLMYIAGAIILVLIVGTMMLLKIGKKDVPKKVNDPKAPVAAPVVVYDPWEYSTVLAECSYDGGSKDVVCLQGNDHMLIPNLLASKGQQGWELAGVYNMALQEKNMTMFAFKRPLNGN